MRILIVEDDRDLAAALDDALRFEGYATRVAYNGLEAVRMLAEQSIDIVLLDRDLPIMSGDAVMETIASNDIPVSVLMLTAAAQVRDRINGLELGADDYLIAVRLSRATRAHTGAATPCRQGRLLRHRILTQRHRPRHGPPHRDP